MSQRRLVYVLAVCGLTLAVMLLALFAGAGRTQAEPALQGPPPDATPSVPVDPDGPQASTATQAPEEPSAPAATAYLHISGSVFVPLYSTSTYAYAGSGCMYFTGGLAQAQFALQVPPGSTITQLRLYFMDTNAANNATMWLRQYDDGLGLTTVATTTTTGSGGWGTDTANFSKVPDYANYSYTLYWDSPVANSTLQLCGFRVGYTPLPFFGVALPIVTK